MRHSQMMMLASAMAFPASLCSISAATGAGDQTSFDDSAMGGGSGGGVNLDKMRGIDQAATDAGTGQMHQAMTGPEDGDQAGDDDSVRDAGEQTGQQDQGADAVEQPDAPADDDADKSGEED